MAPAECIDVLVPTCDRPLALAITLTSIAAQDYSRLHLVVSDQSSTGSLFERPELRALQRYLVHRGHTLELHTHLPRRGMAEQRAFLLSRARQAACLFVDDDVILETDLITRLVTTLRREQCGFVGSALHGLSFLHDVRPQEQAIHFWDTRVAPEQVTPDSAAWARHRLHNAANLLHVQQALGARPTQTRCYRVAWVGGCVLFDTSKLRAAGGFDFWPALPDAHCGEDVLAQLRVMARDGGCALFPSGAYHQELPTTLPTREIDAPHWWRGASG